MLCRTRKEEVIGLIMAGDPECRELPMENT